VGSVSTNIGGIYFIRKFEVSISQSSYCIVTGSVNKGCGSGFNNFCGSRGKNMKKKDFLVFFPILITERYEMVHTTTGWYAPT
jgi:hypothetical protein